MRRAVLGAVVVAVALLPVQPAGAAARAGAPKVVVEPDTDLADGQTVLVTGAGYTPNTQIAIVECDDQAVDPDGCDLGNVAFVDTDDDGVFSTSFHVERVIDTVAFGDEDCATAPGACQLVAANAVDTTEAASADLDFDETLPLPHPLRIEVTLRRIGLIRDEGRVVVEGTLSCNRRADASLEVRLNQQAVPDDAMGVGSLFLPSGCLGSMPFSVAVVPLPGSAPFRPRNAVAEVFAFANIGDDFVDTSEVVRMELQR